MRNYCSSDGKFVGTMRGGIFRKRASKAKHFMKIFDAWGIDDAIIEDIKDTCTDIRILDTDSNSVWTVPFQAFLEHSIVRDFGYGKQRFLSSKYWTIEEKGSVVQERVKSKVELQAQNLRLI